jgi:hypothetical protein
MGELQPLSGYWFRVQKKACGALEDQKSANILLPGPDSVIMYRLSLVCHAEDCWGPYHNDDDLNNVRGATGQGVAPSRNKAYRTGHLPSRRDFFTLYLFAACPYLIRLYFGIIGYPIRLSACLSAV